MATDPVWDRDQDEELDKLELEQTLEESTSPLVGQVCYKQSHATHIHIMVQNQATV